MRSPDFSLEGYTRIGNVRSMAIRKIFARQSLSPAETALQEEADRLRAELAGDVRQQRLKIIEGTLIQLQQLRESQAERSAWRSATSVLEGAQFALEDEGKPLALVELMSAMPRYGKVPGGDNPSWNLSNQMSNAKLRFKRVDWDGKKNWWLANRDTPKPE